MSPITHKYFWVQRAKAHDISLVWDIRQLARYGGCHEVEKVTDYSFDNEFMTTERLLNSPQEEGISPSKQQPQEAAVAIQKRQSSWLSKEG